ncbi:hypothetical protein MRB53_040725 [Persea americana]|nr:hypothetical protein MRB53_040725 [Persea americana]
MFKQDLEDIDALRTDAINCLEPHASGIRKLQAYAAQLVWMGAKFPIDIAADFTWYPSLGYNKETPMTSNSIRFELVNILFNLAVLYCQLGVASNLSTADGLKAASNYFCLSAGVISHLKSTIIPETQTATPEDLDVMTLDSLENLLLAQAQERFWRKAVKDGLKDITIAKLAAKSSDLYNQAADFAVKSDTISSEWIHHMSAKHHHFAAAAQARAAWDCLEKRRYGEEVARLQASLSCANEGLKESRYIGKTVTDDLSALKVKVQDELRRAEKDNDTIYLQPVPTLSELKTLDRASMVTARVTKEISDPLAALSEGSELGKPLFTQLVPYSVHVAASLYTDRRDQCINAIVDEFDLLSTSIRDMLRSLNLPGSLQALEKPLGIPPTLTSHAEVIRQQNGVDRVLRSVNDVKRLRDNDAKTYQEGLNMLQIEAQEDEAAKKRYGTDRWTRVPSQSAAQHLYKQTNEISDFLSKAESSDATVLENYRHHESYVHILAGSDHDLEAFVPSSRRATMTPVVSRASANLRSVMDEVNRLSARRDRKITSLRSKAAADDVTSDILREAARLSRDFPMRTLEAAQFEDFFKTRLQRYDSDKSILAAEKNEQDALQSRLAEANTSFNAAKRSGETATSKEREQALQKLEEAYYAYKEVVQNLDVGRKFYNDLATVVGRYRDECRAFTYQRRQEAARIENDLSSTLSHSLASMDLGRNHTYQQPQNTAPVANMRREGFDANPQYSGQTQQEPFLAPVAVKPQAPSFAATSISPQPATSLNGMWAPEMGIKFASATVPNGVGGQEGSAKGATTWDPSRGMRFG